MPDTRKKDEAARTAAGRAAGAPRLPRQSQATASAPQDAGPSVISLEERYLRELEARPADERFADFAAPPAHAGGQAATYNADEMAAKL